MSARRRQERGRFEPIGTIVTCCDCRLIVAGTSSIPPGILNWRLLPRRGYASGRCANATDWRRLSLRSRLIWPRQSCGCLGQLFRPRLALDGKSAPSSAGGASSILIHRRCPCWRRHASGRSGKQRRLFNSEHATAGVVPANESGSQVQGQGGHRHILYAHRRRSLGRRGRLRAGSWDGDVGFRRRQHCHDPGVDLCRSPNRD